MGRVTAIDTETTGTHPYHGDRCTVVSFADERGAWAVPASEAPAELSRLAADPERRIVMHNSAFDRVVIATSFGIEFPDDRIYDTLTVDWLLGEAESHALKEIGARLFGLDAKAEQTALKAVMRGRTVADVYTELREIERTKPRAERETADTTRARAREIADASTKGWADLTFEDLEAYAVQDARLTLDIYEYQQWEAANGKGPDVRPAIDREMRVAGLAYRMTRTGVRVDEARVVEALEAAEAEADELAASFEGVNLKSPGQVAAMLYDDWGLPVGKRTDSGAPSTDKFALERLAYDPRVARLQAYRQLVKQIDAFYLPLREKIAGDGRIHASFNAHRVVTGRWSCSDPNLMQLPRKGPVRQVFVPDPGYVLLSADLPNAELRITAALTQEPLWLEAFELSRDLHQDMADRMGVDRHTGKTCNFSLLYGVGPHKLALTLAQGSGKTPDVAGARDVIKRYWQAAPAVRAVMSGLEKRWERDRWFPIPGYPGRVRRLESSRGREPGYKALNSAIQGSVAELVKSWMLELEPALAPLGARLVMQVHDSLVLEVPQGAEAAAQALLQETLDAVNPYPMLAWPLDYKEGV